jgi:Iron-containing redox enzyme
MNPTLLMPQQAQDSQSDPTLKDTINGMINDLIMSLPNPVQLTSNDRRGIIARYTAVLEGNFIYWMTATFISVQSEEARPIILENLHEEVRDAHPAMLRRFAIAAHAVPTDSDALAVDKDLTKVRVFLGRLSGVQSVVTMAFFEGFIQRFMGYLADLATAQGSTDMEYTDVHGVCDIAHTDGLFHAFSLESAVNQLEPGKDLLEGVYLLRTLIEKIVLNGAETLGA